MKYGIHFYQGCPILNKADEIIIRYDNKEKELINFVQKWEPEQRIIINITKLKDIDDNLDIFFAASKVHNIAILCDTSQDFSKFNGKIPFFFSQGCDTLSKIMAYTLIGVSDIYITGDVAFDISQIAPACHNRGIKIRAIPNLAQSFGEKRELNSFFIRPEDIKLYEDYVDVFEFHGRLKTQPVFYDIYTREEWNGNLNEIIYGLDSDVNNTTVLPCFGTCRIRCQKRCVYDKCNICKLMESTAKELKDKSLYFTRDKGLTDELKAIERDVSVESDSIT